MALGFVQARDHDCNSVYLIDRKKDSGATYRIDGRNRRTSCLSTFEVENGESIVARSHSGNKSPRKMSETISIDDFAIEAMR